MCQPNLGRISIAWLAAVMLLILPACNRGKDKPDTDSGGTSPAETDLLAITRNALAATENVEPDDAEPLWAKLKTELPKDESVSLNRALNRVLKVYTLADTASNSNLSKAEQTKARSGLPSAIESARNAIESHKKLTSNEVVTLWLSSAIDLREAVLLPKTYGKTLRREIFQRLITAFASNLAAEPESIILAGPLVEVIGQMEDPFDGLPRDILESAAKTLGQISRQHPENLFLAIRAAQLNLNAKDPSVAEHAERSWSLAKAIRPLLYQKTKPFGITPEDYIAKIKTATSSENWKEADVNLLQWFNILNPEEIMKTDRRRVSPHPLDRLSFSGLRSLAAKSSKPIGKGKTKIRFAAQEISQDAVSTLELVDFNLDLEPDLLSADQSGNLKLWKNQSGTFELATSIQMDQTVTGLLTVDLFEADASNSERIKKRSEEDTPPTRHDAFPGVLVYSLDGIKLLAIDGRPETSRENILSIVDQPTGLEEVTGIVKVIPGDLEGDGDLDLLIATKTDGLRLFINRGDRSFFEIENNANLRDQDPIVDLQIVDLDRDLDLDAVVLHGNSGRVSVIENLLHLQFRARELEEVEGTSAAHTIAIGDFDGNVSWDLALVSPNQTRIVFSQTADAGVWTVDRSVSEQFSAGSAVVSDVDNDSWQELLDSQTGQLARLGPWGVDAGSNAQGLTEIVGQRVADIDGDGQLDVAGIQRNKLVVAINKTENQNHFIDVRFKGIADNASGRVNHYAIGSVLEVRFGPHYRAQVVTSPNTHFGLSSFKSPGSIRVIMPNGLTQTIRDAKVDMLVEEEQSLKGSCPYLYAWDGEKFVFMTDCLWAAPLGLQVAPGIVVKDRPWEYLKVDGSKVRSRDGKYDFRITEELWEIAYIDHVALTAVDHPADVEVWTNEKVGPGNIAEPTIFAFRPDDLRSPIAASDTRGNDVMELLSKRDGKFVKGFDERIRQGLCPPHWIDVDFSNQPDAGQTLSDDQTVYLVMTGWIMPTDTSLNIQIDQNPNLPAPEFPSIWVPDNDAPDGWRKAIPYAGFPGGKTKTIVVDVTDAIVKNDPRLRIRTSAQIYWDRVQLAVQDSPAKYRPQDTQLVSAEVAYHGFSKKINHGASAPETYDYQLVEKRPKWPPLRGALTSFGSATDMLKKWDDQMAVISSGDELQLQFTVPTTPVPDGWTRDFVLHCVGWDKDADLNTLTGQSTFPLPSREMSQFPPTLKDEPGQSQVQSINQARLSRHQSFRAFWRRQNQHDQEKRFLTWPHGG